MSADATNPTVVIQDEDGTNNVAVKAASTAAVGADKALVVAISPNNTVPISVASLPLPAGAALDATLTGGTQKAIIRGGAKGSTTAADVTSTASGANHQPVDVAIYDAAGNQITSFGGGTQYTVNDAAPADPIGPTLVAERDDQLSTLSEAEGDWTQVRASSKGALWVTIPDSNGDPITSFGGGTQYADGVARGTATGTLAMVDDGVNIQSALGDSSGRLIVAGAGVAGTPAGGVVSIQGVASGTVVPVSDGGASLTVDSTQLPAALVGARLDVNQGAWLGSTAPTVGSKTSADSVPVVIASDQGAVPVTVSGVATAANQTTLGNQTTKINDGTNTAAVKAAATEASGSDTALVVALSPNNTPFQFGGDNRLRVGQESMALFDTFEGAAVDTRWWTASQSGMTQTVSGGILTLNAGASLTNANYSILNSNKNIRFAVEFGIYYQCRARVIAFANVTQEFGIGSVATNAAPTNGGFFRMVGTTLTGVINHNGTETSTATLATLANASYYSFEIFYYEETVKFEVSGADGVVVAEATIQIPMGQASFSTSSAIPAFFRTYNTGTAGTAGQLLVGSVAVTSMDSLPVFLDTSSLTNVASSASSVNLVTTNPNRKRVNIANDSTQVLFIKFGTTASSTSYTYRLTSNTSISIASEEWSGNIDGIWAAANGNARITEIM